MAQESAYFIAKSIDDRHDIRKIKKELDTLHGVRSVSVDARKDLVCVDYDSSGVSYDKIEAELGKLGYQIVADASNIQTR